ncbi:hypothetical protein KL86CLO1_11878 [uncultured Eubacteriales bacterium]|uniref:Uncharacterized protein n=1 Tax=uncultured Eubacteriales bacterium TaxID=172733 RepID=A0A212JXS3_9FIRM|nr:hypothetical protein KL86CLO1_11878 [uncultured Eubacteriales bacterium]
MFIIASVIHLSIGEGKKFVTEKIKRFLMKNGISSCNFRTVMLLYQSRLSDIRVWRSLVSRLNGVQEAAGSNPVTRTKEKDLKPLRL